MFPSIQSIMWYSQYANEPDEREHPVSCVPPPRFMSVMKVTSVETEVVVAVKYFYLLACKPQEA